MPPFRTTHHRTHDHTGTEPDTAVVIEEAIGPFEAGTPIGDVIRHLVLRVADLEATQGADRRVATFSISAWIPPHFALDAVIQSAISATFTLDAVLGRGGRFGIDALIVPGSTFTLDALIV